MAIKPLELVEFVHAFVICGHLVFGCCKIQWGGFEGVVFLFFELDILNISNVFNINRLFNGVKNLNSQWQGSWQHQKAAANSLSQEKMMKIRTNVIYR